MSAVLLVLGHQARRRWTGWVGLALLVALAAGATMALAAAARRSDDAYARFADAERAADVVMTGRSTFGLVGTVDLRAAAASPAVRRSAGAFVAIPFSGSTAAGRHLDAADLLPVAATDGRLGHTVERWKLLAGRRAQPGRVHEATASFVLAQRAGLHVGSRLTLRFYRADHFPSVAARILGTLARRVDRRDRTHQRPTRAADGPVVHFRIVGVEASPAEFPPLLNDLAPVLHLTPAFARRYASTVVGSPLGYFGLRHRDDLRPLQLAIERAAAGRPVSFVTTRANQQPKVERAIRAEAVALAIVAALVGITAAVAIGQALVRQVLADTGEFTTLRALGMRDAQLRLLVLLRILAIGAAGAVLGGLLATLGAQLALLPLARTAELHGGVHPDAVVLGLGTVVLLGFAVVVGAVAARLALRREAPPAPTALARRAERATAATPLPVPVAIGVRLATRRAARAIPPWATLVATALTVALLTGALTFTASLRRLLDEPARYGWNWDLKIGAPGLPDLGAAVVPALRGDDRVVAFSSGTVTQIDAGRARIDVLGLDTVEGHALPTITSGRAPRRTDEIAVGGRSLTTLHTHVGGTVDARIGTRTARLRVVGRSVMPEFGDAGQLGTGALMTARGLRRLLPESPTNVFLVRFRPGAGGPEGRAAMARAVEPIPTSDQARPQDLTELSRGGGLLTTLVTLLAVLGFAALLHALLTSVRGRARFFAVLRVVGLTRRQVRATVVWQVLTLVVGAVVVGVPLGVVGGRLAWATFAGRLGVATDADLPSAGTVALVTAGAVVVALAAALLPSRLAARFRPARVLATG